MIELILCVSGYYECLDYRMTSYVFSNDCTKELLVFIQTGVPALYISVPQLLDEFLVYIL